MNQKFSDLYLKTAYFFISRQIFFRRLFIGWFFFINLILWVFVIVAFTNYFSGTYIHEREMEKMSLELIKYSDYRETHQAVDLRTVRTDVVFEPSNKTYDFVAKIQNRNENWAGTKVSYYFDYGQGVTPVQTDYILPGQTKYLFSFSNKLAGSPVVESRNVKLVVGDVSWKRIPDSKSQEILKDLQVLDYDFQKQEGYSYLDFTVLNQSPYDFWETSWQVVLFRGNRIIGVNQVASNSFISEQESGLRATWFSVLSTPQEVEILPDVDLLKNDTIIEKNSDPNPKEVK
jgi:hypothetical protein